MIKTDFIFKWAIILALLVGFTSCKKGWWGYEEGNGGGNNGGGNENKTELGTVISFACGRSIYGHDYWIKLDNGKLIQPCDQSFMGECFFYLNEGDRVELKYSKYTKNNSTFDIMCKIANLNYTKATIDYIKKINKNFNCKTVKFYSNFDEKENQNIQVLGARIEGNKLNLKIGFSGCNMDMNRFELYAKPAITNDFFTYDVKIVDEIPQLCEAYFTNEMCFDITQLKDNTKRYVRIKINGFEQILNY